MIGKKGCRWTVVIGVATATVAITSACSQPQPKTYEAAAEVTDRIPYHRDMTCTSTMIHDRGKTPADQIRHSLPGKLELGTQATEIEKQTDWILKKSPGTLDKADWYYLAGRPGTEVGEFHLAAQAIDLDRDGDLDWINVSADAGSRYLRGIVSRIDGGRVSRSKPDTPGKCHFDRRHAFASIPPPSDRAFGEQAYCAAAMECRISDAPLCSNPFAAPVLIVDEIGSYVRMTLFEDSAYRPARSPGFRLPRTIPACHSFLAQRSYL